jgi:hypothetical protein
MVMDPDKVWNDVNSITKKRVEWDEGKLMRGALIEEFTDKMKEQHPYLSKNSDLIFNKCVNKELDIKKLKEMLHYIRQIKNGKDQEEVTRKVGEVLADRYVKPLVAKLDRERELKKNKVEELD